MERLRACGQERLAVLFDRTREAEFLGGIEDQAYEYWYQSDYTRHEVEIEGLRIGLQAIPSEQMKVICGQAGEERIETTKLSILFQAAEHFHLHFFAIDGWAAELTDDKGENSRPMTRTGDYFPSGKKPIDADGLLVGNGDISLEEISRWINGKIRGLWWAKNFKAEVVNSRKREGFQSLQLLCKPWKGKWESVAQIAYPEHNGEYSGDFRLLHHVLSRPSRPLPVLILPINGVTDCDIPNQYFGVAIDLAPEELEMHQKPVEISIPQWGVSRRLSPIFVSPDAFYVDTETIGGGQEGFYHLIHLFRQLAWRGKDGSIPIMRNSTPVQTSLWFRDNIIEPIVRFSTAYYDWNTTGGGRSLLGLRGEEVLFAEELVDGLRQAFEGDPEMTLLRCLPLRISGSICNVAGMGIFSSEGFFPQLQDIFSRGDWENAQECLAELRACPEGDGWKVFTRFLQKQVRKDSRKQVAEILTPNISRRLNRREIPLQAISNIVYSGLFD